MNSKAKYWVVVVATSLLLGQATNAQVERLAYSFEGNGEEGRGENNFALNKGYFPLTDDGNFMAQGRSGMALSDDLLAIGSIEPFTVEKPLTASLWFKPTDLGAEQTLLTRVNPKEGQGLRMTVTTQGHLQVELTDNLGGRLAFASETVITADNSWYHLAFTYKADLEEVQLYINGEVVTLNTLSNTLSGDISTAHPLVLGGDQALNPITGGLDEVQIIPLYFSELNMLCLNRLEPDCAYKPTEATRGPRGFTGPMGPVGERGDRGLKGPQGDQGEQGETGAAGQRGAKGPKGLTGIRGPKGLMGPAGLDGVDGADGQDGADGPRGPTGPKGNRGATGDKGYAGIRGPQGATGSRGSTGPKGPRGLKGEKGDTGSPGEKGPRGAVGAVGQTGPQGVKGARGIKGETGDKGNVGPRGPQGPRGAKGIVGIAGVRGPTGPRGWPGPKGYSGCDPLNPYYVSYLCRNRHPNSMMTSFTQEKGAYDSSKHPVIDLTDYGIRSWDEARRLVAAIGKGPRQVEQLIETSIRNKLQRERTIPFSLRNDSPGDLRDLKDLLLELDAIKRTHLAAAKQSDEPGKTVPESGRKSSTNKTLPESLKDNTKLNSSTKNRFTPAALSPRVLQLPR